MKRNVKQMKSILNKFASNPKSLFLMDGIGAAISFIILRFVLPKFQELIGMPTTILLNLSLFACVLLAYSAYCFFDVKNNLPNFLLGLAIANCSYCLISFYFIITYFSELTWIGISYFILEKIIVLTLIYIEFKTANKLKNNI